MVLLIRSGECVLAVGVDEPLRYTVSSKLCDRVGVEKGERWRSGKRRGVVDKRVSMLDAERERAGMSNVNAVSRVSPFSLPV